MHVIPNGVGLPPARAKRRSSPLTFGVAARISPDKKLEQLLLAVRHAHPRLPRYELRIAGGMERGQNAYVRRLRRLARGLPVHWCGEYSDAGAFLETLDIFAMISEPAGCPNASLEAMAAGLPIVATDHGGAGEQVIDGLTGRLVKRGDVLALGDALVALAHDPAERERLGRNARALIHAEFSLPRMIARYTALCDLHEGKGVNAGKLLSADCGVHNEASAG